MGLLLMVYGCSRNDPPPSFSSRSVAGEEPSAPHQPATGCRGCHPLALDERHDFPCQDCHLGDGNASEQKAAHGGLIPQPAHPDRMSRFCGRCHGSIVEQVSASIHYTSAKEVNLVRQAFGNIKPLASLTAIPQEAVVPVSPGQLVDDLLRRRCLRCHVYSSGEAYPATRHGTGCAACHLGFVGGSLADHSFIARPSDQQCLGCHYGNRVGADYYGRFEHDLNWEYRTPLYAGEEKREPYGLGYHQLAPDLHQQAGMVCIDCHGAGELMAGTESLSCRSCHDGALAQGEGPVSKRDGRRELLLSCGKVVAVPVMADPAHARYGHKVGCQVCHGQWAFADYGTHLIRMDDPDYEPWQSLTRQGSAEIETRLETALFVDGGESEAIMDDGITGASSPGVWLLAYERRRWEDINTCLDRHGTLQVCRPILDLHLSYRKADGELVFDAITPDRGTPAMTPYTPHTTGKAGAFYLQRLKNVELP